MLPAATQAGMFVSGALVPGVIPMYTVTMPVFAYAMKFILTGLLLELPKALAEAIVSSTIVDIIFFICDLHSPFQPDNFVTPKYQRRESGSLLVLISKRSGCSVETGRGFANRLREFREIVRATAQDNSIFVSFPFH
jgi:hypothetical protein